tara:strand:+ start:981 stop:1856 length:876 start_codon:yes stop_codon:yes gene_type:complete
MVNKLILGTVQLGLDYGINNQLGKPTLEKAFDILHTAYDNGVRILDTAEAYGNSVEVIGKFQKRHPNKKFNIISKLAANTNLSSKDLFSHVSEGCKILNTDQLYGYMFHNYMSFKQNTNFYEELLNLKSKGLTLHIGISLYTNEEILDVAENFSDFDFIQIPFNLLDNDLKRKKAILKAKESNIAIHTRSTFLQGLFFIDPNTLTDTLLPLKPYLQEIEKIKLDYNLTTESLALQYVIQKEYINHVLVGVETSQQLIDNIKLCGAESTIPHSKVNKLNVLKSHLLNPSNWN